MPEYGSQLDTSIEVVTPENIAFQYRVAGPSRRFVAYLVDLLIRRGILIVLFFIFVLGFGFAGLAGLGLGVFLLIIFVDSWFYYSLFEIFWNGQTPGKRLLGIRVLSVDGQPINALQAVIRNILRTVDSAPFFILLVPISEEVAIPFVLSSYGIGIAAASLNDRFQRLGDLACGTIVAIEERSRAYGLVRVEDPSAIRLAAELPPQLEISRTLGRALSNYVERRRVFSPGRQADIARHIGEPLCEKWNLPPGTSHDLLLRAIYYRTFITDQADHGFAGDASSPLVAVVAPQTNPFAIAPAPPGAAGVMDVPEIQTAPVTSRYQK